ncbi:MAG: NAD(P)-dependent oxidoreductase [Bacteroidota bacterium]|nr:NAD(P)-dependent oxidoreductase [Bacteroidota bacterium]
MKTILITGSNGLLGQKLVEALVKKNEMKVVATSLGENRLLNIEGYVYHELDITEKQKVNELFLKFRPDVIINTAAMTNVDACETQKELCFKLNVTAVQNMVDVLTENKLDAHFIHLSTDFVFDGEKGGPYVETDLPNPQSYYAHSKVESEKLLQKSSIRWAIARTIIVYGIANKMSRSNIVLWAKEALEKGQKINVVDDQFRAPTLAEDLARGCIQIAEKDATGFYHLSGPETMSILELVYSVADLWKLDRSLITPSKSNNLNQAAKRPPRTGFIIDKAKKELGYAPHSFAEGLALLAKQL